MKFTLTDTEGNTREFDTDDFYCGPLEFLATRGTEWDIINGELTVLLPAITEEGTSNEQLPSDPTPESNK
jgi:hypothetical protein